VPIQAVLPYVPRSVVLARFVRERRLKRDTHIALKFPALVDGEK